MIGDVFLETADGVYGVCWGCAGVRSEAAPVVWKGGVRVGFGPFHRRRRQQWSLLLTATLTTTPHSTGRQH